MEAHRGSLLFRLVLRALSSPLYHLFASAGPGPEATQGPRWMQAALVAGGIYNLIWGGWVAFFPSAPFRWAGIAPANYPQFWQRVGVLATWGIVTWSLYAPRRRNE
jgi:hypothetical protein